MASQALLLQMSSTVIDLYFRFFSSSSILKYLNVIVEVLSIDGYYGVYVRPLRRHVYAHNWWVWPEFRRALRARRHFAPPFLKILATRLRLLITFRQNGFSICVSPDPSTSKRRGGTARLTLAMPLHMWM